MDEFSNQIIIVTIMLLTYFPALLLVQLLAPCRSDSYGCEAGNIAERRQLWSFEIGRMLFTINEMVKFLWFSPIYFNHRTAEFKNIARSFYPNEKGSSYRDHINPSDVDTVLKHVYYGRMVQSVYHLSDSNVMSERYGESILYSVDSKLASVEDGVSPISTHETKTVKFLERVFKGYEIKDILRTTVDTPNQLKSATGKFLAELALRNGNIYYHRCKGNFMGFIAYNKEQEDLAIVFRGTNIYREWIQNVVGFGSEWKDNDEGKEINCGCDERNLDDQNRIYKIGQLLTSLIEDSKGDPFEFLVFLPGALVLWFIIGRTAVLLEAFIRDIARLIIPRVVTFNFYLSLVVICWALLCASLLIKNIFLESNTAEFITALVMFFTAFIVSSVQSLLLLGPVNAAFALILVLVDGIFIFIGGIRISWTAIPILTIHIIIFFFWYCSCPVAEVESKI